MINYFIKRFKNDIGVFAPLIMNHIILEPGECCFYGILSAKLEIF